jgi:uncharacterized MnhB-related membrane protein
MHGALAQPPYPVARYACQKVVTVLNVYVVVLVVVLLGCAVAALLAKSLVQSAVALGVGSASLAMLYFVLDAPYAGGFELSVGAGLTSVLFIVAISLTKSLGDAADED